MHESTHALPVSHTPASVHMGSMPTLHTDLRKLLTRHRNSGIPEVQDVLRELASILASAPTPAYQYRNHPKWDDTWMDLDESQLEIVLKMGHTVERQALLGPWEPVTEAPA